jgi:hypothetical protein
MGLGLCAIIGIEISFSPEVSVFFAPKGHRFTKPRATPWGK